jgi:putative transposase
MATELDRTHPSAAESLREGLQQTLTVPRLGVPPTLTRTVRSTNPIESTISICRHHSTNVKLWCDGQMALRRRHTRRWGHVKLPGGASSSAQNHED